MRSAHFKLLIFAFILTITTNYGCNELCDWYQAQYIEQCQAQSTGLVAGNVGDHYQKSSTVWRFAFNLPGSSAQNCDIKFLEHKSIIEVDSIEVVRYADHNIGNALYLVNEITDINNDTSFYKLLQIRETFDGIYNNDGICDGGNMPSLPNFYVRFKQCKQYAILGDSFGLRIH